MWDTVLTECHLATLAPGAPDFGGIRDAALAIEGGRIAWIGPATHLPAREARETIRLHGAWITPGLHRLPHPSGLRRQPRP